MPAACPSFLTPPLPASDPGPPLPAPPPRYQVLAPQRLCPPPSPLLPNSNWACPAALPRRLLHRAAPSRPRSEDCATTIARQLTSRDGPFPPAPTRRRRPCGLRRQPPLLGLRSRAAEQPSRGGCLLGRPARPGQVGQRRRSATGISGTPCILPLLPCAEGAPRRAASAAAERRAKGVEQTRPPEIPVPGRGRHAPAALAAERRRTEEGRRGGRMKARQGTTRRVLASAGSRADARAGFSAMKAELCKHKSSILSRPPGRGRDGQGEAPAGFGGRPASPPAPVQSRLRQLRLRTAVRLTAQPGPARPRPALRWYLGLWCRRAGTASRARPAVRRRFETKFLDGIRPGFHSPL